MPDALSSRLQGFRRRVRRLLWTYGLSRVVTLVFGAAICVGLLDWAVHLDDPNFRLILAVGILAGGVWSAWRYLAAPLSCPFSETDLALRIERRHPELQDGLSSTVQFLAEGSAARLGSPQLQQRTIDETLDRVAHIDLGDVIEPRVVRRAATTAGTVCLVAAILAMLNGPAAGLALSRLVFPLSAGSWPRQTNLRLLDAEFQPLEHDPQTPLRVTRGSTLEVFVEDAHGRLPDVVRMECQVGDGEFTAETLRRTSLRDDDGELRNVGVATIPTDRGPVWFRAVGGDDDVMPLYELQVVPAPLVEDLQVTLTPPAYSGRAVERLSPGVGHVQSLVGTRVEISAGVNKPLATAGLRIKDRKPAPLELTGDGRRFRASFVLDEPGAYSYWFDLRDREGFDNPRSPRYEIRATADLAPQVSVERPGTDLNVTRDATISLRIVAKDDLGLRELRLRYRTGDSTDAPLAGIPLPFQGRLPNHAEAETDWDLAELKLSEGVRIVYHAEASDDFNLGPEHVGKSASRSIIIVSPDEKSREIDARQAALWDQLDSVLTTQLQAREQVGELHVQWNKAGVLRPNDFDLLKRIDLEQRRIAERLQGPAEGVATQASQLLAELHQNRVESRETERRLKQLVEELRTLGENALPAVQQQLTEAVKEAETAANNAARQPNSDKAQNAVKPAAATPNKPPEAARGAAALAKAQQGQSAVVESLATLLRDMARWRDRRDLSQDLAEMIARQKELNAQTGELGKQTLTRPVPELTPQEQADLARLAERQSRQAERVGRFSQGLDESAAKLSQGDPAAEPPAANPFAAARDQLRQNATADKMRETADRLVKNKVGEAMIDQQKILDELQKAQQALERQDALDSESLVEHMRRTEQDLETLKKRQAALRDDAEKLTRQDKKTPDKKRSASADPQQLRKEQQDVREQAQALSPRLRRLQARRSADAMGRAASRMQQAEHGLEQGEHEQAAENAGEALEDIDQAQRDLARARRQAEERLAQESLERLADELHGMISRQQSVIDETTRLDAERGRRGNWSRGQLKSLADLAEDQRRLHGETGKLAEKVATAEVFAVALRGAAQDMDQAANRLSQRLTDKPTLDAETRARARFVDLEAALQPDKPDKGADQNQPASEPQLEEGASPPGEQVAIVSQLKMLKTLQQDLARRTAELDASRPKAGDFSPDQQAEMGRLADEQSQLAELATRLARSVFGDAAGRGTPPSDSDASRKPATAPVTKPATKSAKEPATKATKEP